MGDQIFSKNKIFNKSTQKSVNLSPSNGLLVSTPHLHLTWGVWGAFYKTPHFWGVGKITGFSDVIHVDFTTLAVKIDTKIEAGSTLGRDRAEAGKYIYLIFVTVRVRNGLILLL